MATYSWLVELEGGSLRTLARTEIPEFGCDRNRRGWWATSYQDDYYYFISENGDVEVICEESGETEGWGFLVGSSSSAEGFNHRCTTGFASEAVPPRNLQGRG